jgi:hypothetical protein
VGGVSDRVVGGDDGWLRRREMGEASERRDTVSSLEG